MGSAQLETRPVDNNESKEELTKAFLRKKDAPPSPTNKESPPSSPTNQNKSSGSLKFWLLVLLVIQGSAAIMTGRYTRSSVPEEELYEISHLIFVIELF